MNLPTSQVQARPARPADIPAITEIYNQGISDRVATFETRLRTPEDIAEWFIGRPVIVVAEAAEAVCGFAHTLPYRMRDCYQGVAEFSVYVHREHRGRGIGKVVMAALIEDARKRGIWKLVSRVFPENTPSRKLLGQLGFREVGTYHRHGKLDGVWKDVVIVEYLIKENIA
ncbi:MAG: N-acetyltransferase [Calditrichaeota bacterium]|nr:N-acetyltransferase [Calditrichota bacterium]MCB0294948.1 N-acetyltransferase [Calditrichota bacterium]MCB0306419.1 N-acetyltransferase [Calditrichota bacterium]MCB9086832.1 N-acetyltransferase [Calditrichia bacterium]